LNLAMERLRAADIDALVDVVHDIGEVSDLASFRSELLSHMRRLVACEIAAYNAVGPAPADVEVVVDPPGAYTADMAESFAAHVQQNPMVGYHARDPHAPAARLSDFISPRQLRRLELYDLVYRPLRTEHQIAITIPGADRVIGITASRGGRDYAESELRLLDAVRPFLAAAMRNLEARRRIEATIAALGQAESEPAAILLVGPGGRIEPSDDRADRWLGASADRRSLETELEAWARAAARACADLDTCGRPERRWIEHPNGPHRIQYVPGTGARPAAILVDVPAREMQPDRLQRLGLTRRQSEVLHLVSLGHTNAGAAQLLGVSEHTIAHHLEEVYRRLDVSTRIAAVRRADERLAAL
jgi:DNA-binding CsgD family transcriptional regulator